MKYAGLSIKTYLNKLAGKTPVPGGGSAAALFGAIGCALMEMVLNYSKNSSLVKKSVVLLKNHRKRFLHLVDEDINAYKKLSSLRKKDSQALQKALKKATLVPLEVCYLSCKGVDLCGKLLKKANRNLISDVGCAISAFVCAFNSARLNADVNIKYIKDRKFVNSVRKQIEALKHGKNSGWKTISR